MKMIFLFSSLLFALFPSEIIAAAPRDTDLMNAAKNGRYDDFEYLFQKIPKESCQEVFNDVVERAFGPASRLDDSAIVEFFFEFAKRGNLDIVKLLVPLHIPAMIRNGQALIIAAFYGREEVVKYFVKKREVIENEKVRELPPLIQANINKGYALTIAARNGHSDVADCLLESGGFTESQIAEARALLDNPEPK